MTMRGQMRMWLGVCALAILFIANSVRAQEGTLRFADGSFASLPTLAGTKYQGNMGFDLWFYLDEISTPIKTLVSGGSSWSNGVALYVEGTSLEFKKCHASTCKTITPSATLRAKRWHHVVFGKHGANNRIRIWVDGESVSDVTDSFFHESQGEIVTPFLVGKGPDASTPSPYNGLMDEIRFWNQYPDVRIYESFTYFYYMASSLYRLSTREILDGDAFKFGVAQQTLAAAYDGTLSNGELMDEKSDSAQNAANVTGVIAYLYAAPSVVSAQTFRANNLLAAGNAFAIVALTNAESSYVTFANDLEPTGRFRVLPNDHLLAISEKTTLAWSETSNPSSEVPDQLVNLQLVASDGRFQDEESAQVTIFGGVPPKAPHVEEAFLHGDLSAGPGGVAGILHIADVNEDLIVAAELSLPAGVENDLVSLEYSQGDDFVTIRWKADLLSALKSDSYHSLESYPVGESGHAEKCADDSLLSAIEMQIGLEDSQGFQETHSVPLYFRASDPRPTFAEESACGSLSCSFVLSSWDIAQRSGYQTFGVGELIAGTQALQNHSGSLGQDESQAENELGVGVWCDESCRSGRWQYAESAAARTALGEDAWHDIVSDPGTSCIPTDTFGSWGGCLDWNGNVSQNKCDCPEYYHQTHYPFLLLPPDALLRYRHDYGISSPSEVFAEDSLQIKIWDGQQGGPFRTWVGEHETYCTRKGSLSEATNRLEPHTVESEIQSQVLGLSRTSFVEPCQNETECAAGEGCFDGYCRTPPSETCTENWDCAQGTGECIEGQIAGCTSDTCGRCFYDDPRGFVVQGAFEDGNRTDLHRIEVVLDNDANWLASVSDIVVEEDDTFAEGNFSFRLHVLPNYAGQFGVTVKIFEANADEVCSQNAQCGTGKSCTNGFCFANEAAHSLHETLTVQALPDATMLDDFAGRGFRSTHNVYENTAHYLQIGEVTTNAFQKNVPDIYFDRLGTAEIWFKPASFDAQSKYPLLHNWSHGWQVQLTSNGARLCFLNACSVLDEALWNAGETEVPWMHLAMTLEDHPAGRAVRFYRDGVPLRIEAADDDGYTKSLTLPTSSQEGMHVGYASGSLGTNAYFDELRIWAEVHRNYSDGSVTADERRFYVPRADEPGLLAWFDFDHIDASASSYSIRNRASSAAVLAAKIFHAPGNTTGVTAGKTSKLAAFRAPAHAAFVMEAKSNGPDALFFPLVSWFSDAHPNANNGQLYPDLRIPEDSQTVFLTKWHDADFAGTTSTSLTVQQGDADRLQIESHTEIPHAFVLRPELNFSGLFPELALGFLGDPSLASDDRTTYFDLEIIDLPEPIRLKTGVPNYADAAVVTCTWNEDQEQKCDVDLDAYVFDEDSTAWTVRLMKANTLEPIPTWLSSQLSGHLLTLDGIPALSCLGFQDTLEQRLWVDVCDEQPTCERIAVDVRVLGRNDAPVQPPGSRYGFITYDDSASENAITEDDVDTAGRRIFDLLYDYIDDDDTCAGANDNAGLVISDATVAYGQWEYRLSGSGAWQSLQAKLAEGQGLTLTRDAIVRYVPDGDHGVPQGAQLVAHLWDGTGAAQNGDLVSLELRGGNAPYAEHARTYVLRVDEVSEPIRLAAGIPSSEEGIAWTCDTWTEDIAWAQEEPTAVNRCALDTHGWFEQDDGEDVFFALPEMSETRNFAVSQNDETPHLVEILGQGGIHGLPLGSTREVDVILRAIEPATGFHEARHVDVRIRIPILGQNNAPTVTDTMFTLPELSKGQASEAFVIQQWTSVLGQDDDFAAGYAPALGLALVDFTGSWEWRSAGDATWQTLQPIGSGSSMQLFPATAEFRFAGQPTAVGTFAIHAYIWDQSSGVPFSFVPHGRRGENTSFSVARIEISQPVIERNLPPLITQLGPLSVNENTTGELGRVLSIQDDDAELNQLLSVRVISEHAERFSIHPDGMLFVDGLLDYELAVQHEILVEVHDGGHPPQNFSVLVLVNDEDDTPPEIQNCPVQIAISPSDHVGDVFFVPDLYDPDTSPMVSVFELTQDGATAATFAITTAGLRLTAAADAYLERVPSRRSTLRIAVSDGTNEREDACVIPVHFNSPPSIRVLEEIGWQLAENSPVSTTFGARFSAVDEEGDSLTWTVLEAQVISQRVVWLPSIHFGLDMETKQLSSLRTLDFETRSFHPLRLQVMDEFQASDTYEFEVYISDVNEPPFLEEGVQVLAVPQTIRANEVILRLPVKDPEGSDMHFSTTDEVFRVETGGELSVKANAFSTQCVSNVNCRPLYDKVGERFDVSVSVSDGANARDFVFELVVVDVDEAPVWIEPDARHLVIFAWEHSVPGEVSFSWAAMDPDSANASLTLEKVTAEIPFLYSFRVTPNQFHLAVSELPPSEHALKLRISDGTKTSDRDFTVHVFERDQDEDGLTDRFEEEFGLSVTEIDSDGDGITDLIESGCPIGERASSLSRTALAVTSSCVDVENAAQDCPLAVESLRSTCLAPLDSDEDGLWDPIDDDSDDDGLSDADESLHFFGDADQDGVYSGRDPDADNDGVPDGEDNCWLVANADQRAVWSSLLEASRPDAGRSGTKIYGDACHPDFADAGAPDWLAEWDDGGQVPSWIGENDSDNDNIPDALDNCVDRFNPTQQDRDGDGLGDLCDGDMDGDGFANDVDVCPFVFDPDQVDADQDGDGDRCDGDWDNDGILNDNDRCPHQWGDNVDGCAALPVISSDAGVLADGGESVEDAGQEDAGSDADVAQDQDQDQDHIPDIEDNCPDIANETQDDLDLDGVGDACDEDDDGDDIVDGDDLCPHHFNPAQIDLDQDGVGDECDPDIDGDGIPNVDDACPYWSNPRDEMNQVVPCGGLIDAQASSCNQTGIGSFAAIFWILTFGWVRNRRQRMKCTRTSSNHP